ncbi:MAG: hypothetical protein AB9919_02800 [Geobacteraceae bacterium]
MSTKNSADFSLFKNELSPTALACFRVIFGNIRETIAKQGPQQKYETPLDDFLSLNEVADVEAVAQSIREIIQCKVEKKVDTYSCFYPFFAKVSIEGGKISYSILKDVEDEIAHIPAVFFV